MDSDSTQSTSSSHPAARLPISNVQAHLPDQNLDSQRFWTQAYSRIITAWITRNSFDQNTYPVFSLAGGGKPNQVRPLLKPKDVDAAFPTSTQRSGTSTPLQTSPEPLVSTMPVSELPTTSTAPTTRSAVKAAVADPPIHWPKGSFAKGKMRGKSERKISITESQISGAEDEERESSVEHTRRHQGAFLSSPIGYSFMDNGLAEDSSPLSTVARKSHDASPSWQLEVKRDVDVVPHLELDEGGVHVVEEASPAADQEDQTVCSSPRSPDTNLQQQQEMATVSEIRQEPELAPLETSPSKRKLEETDIGPEVGQDGNMPDIKRSRSNPPSPLALNLGGRDSFSAASMASSSATTVQASSTNEAPSLTHLRTIIRVDGETSDDEYFDAKPTAEQHAFLDIHSSLDPWAAEITNVTINTMTNPSAWLSDAELVPTAEMIAAAGGSDYINLGTDFLTDTMDSHRCARLRNMLSTANSARLQAREVLLTINIDNMHWVLGVADLVGHEMRLYDSLSCQPDGRWASRAQQVLHKAVEYLFTPILNDAAVPAASNPCARAPTMQQRQQCLPAMADLWPVEMVQCPQQRDKASCGVYTLVNMIHVIAGMTAPLELEPRIWRAILGLALRQSLSGSEPDAKQTQAQTISDVDMVSKNGNGSTVKTNHVHNTTLPVIPAQHTLTALIIELEASLHEPRILPVDALTSLPTAKTHADLLAITQASTSASTSAVRRTLDQIESFRTQLASARRTIARLHLKAVEAEEAAGRFVMAARAKVAHLRAAKSDLSTYIATMQRSCEWADQISVVDAEEQHETAESMAKRSLRRAVMQQARILGAAKRLAGLCGDTEFVGLGLMLDRIEEPARALLEEKEKVVAVLAKLH